MTVDGERWSIGEVARRSGVPASTLRYYEAIGLLGPVERSSGRRVYDPAVLTALGMIRRAQTVGLSLEEIGGLLEASAQARGGERLGAIAARKLPEIEADLTETLRARRWMRAARRCRCRRLEDCGLFEEVCAA